MSKRLRYSGFYISFPHVFSKLRNHSLAKSCSARPCWILPPPSHRSTHERALASVGSLLADVPYLPKMDGGIRLNLCTAECNMSQKFARVTILPLQLLHVATSPALSLPGKQAMPSSPYSTPARFGSSLAPSTSRVPQSSPLIFATVPQPLGNLHTF